MPTRVLQIDDTNTPMSAGGGSSLSLKLVEPPHSTQTEYACLSHCWGKLGPVKTTKASKLQFLQCIPWDVLPRSFQEAISFAHMLNIRYLWIDSLCIIQDDPDDVEREIRQMCRIYEGAVVTLAITKSHMPSEGCFSTLSPESAGYEIPVPATFDWPAAVVREVFDHAHAVSSYNNPPPGKAPLLSRGWVLQERILSRRVLHFTAEELAFECVTARCCECERDPHEMPGFKSTMSQAVETDDRDGLYLKWRALVERYTTLDLTFETDRLPAIAGLAEKFERRLNDRYFYGTWAGNLLESLNWLSFIPIRRDRRPATPSWSWAAASSAVRHPYPEKWAEPNQQDRCEVSVEHVAKCAELHLFTTTLHFLRLVAPAIAMKIKPFTPQVYKNPYRGQQYRLVGCADSFGDAIFPDFHLFEGPHGL